MYIYNIFIYVYVCVYIYIYIYSFVIARTLRPWNESGSSRKRQTRKSSISKLFIEHRLKLTNSLCDFQSALRTLGIKSQEIGSPDPRLLRGPRVAVINRSYYLVNH